MNLYPFQNRIQVSNRGGSIFLICDQSDLEAGFHFGTGISRKVTAPHKVQPLDSIAILNHNVRKSVYTTELPIVFANHGFRYQMKRARQGQQGHAWRKFAMLPIEGHLDQCKTCIRDKGQKVNQALPKRWEAGTKPQYRESEDDPRLSPIIK